MPLSGAKGISHWHFRGLTKFFPHFSFRTALRLLRVTVSRIPRAQLLLPTASADCLRDHLRQRPVHLRAARRDAVKFPLAGHSDHAVMVGGGEVSFAVENRLLGFARLGKHLPAEVDDLRVPGKAKAAFLAHAV